MRRWRRGEESAATGGGGDATGGFSALEVGTVDGFRREKEAIVISMVRRMAAAKWASSLRTGG